MGTHGGRGEQALNGPSLSCPLPGSCSRGQLGKCPFLLGDLPWLLLRTQASPRVLRPTWPGVGREAQPAASTSQSTGFRKVLTGSPPILPGAHHLLTSLLQGISGVPCGVSAGGLQRALASRNLAQNDLLRLTLPGARCSHLQGRDHTWAHFRLMWMGC